MLVRTKLRISFLVPFATLVVLLLFLNLAQRKWHELYRREDLVNRITLAIYDRNLLINDYLRYPSSRSEMQLTRQHQTIQELISKAQQEFPEKDRQSTLTEMQTRAEEVKDLINQLITHSSSDSIIDPLASEAEVRLAEQILIKSQTNITASLTLVQQARNDSTQLHIISYVIIFFLFSFNVLITLFMWKFIKRFIKGLEMVSAETKKIAAGDLNHRVPVHSHDEIGKLAESFNVMTERLKKSYNELEFKIKERTKELQQAKAKSDSILASIGDGLFATDLTGKLVLVNQVFEKLTGWTRDEVIGINVANFLTVTDEDGDVIADEDRLISQVIQKRITFTTSTTNHFYTRKDGTRFPVMVTVSPIYVDQELIGAVETFRDISEEKEIDRAKTDFISMASHQLLTPIAVVQGYISMAVSGKYGTISDQIKYFLNESLGGAKRMSELVKRLLTTSRLDTNSLKMHITNFELNEVVTSVINDLKLKSMTKNIKLVYKPSNKIVVKADMQQLREVLSNLLDNAIKYTEQGSVLIKVSEKVEKFVQVSIIDSGVGIAPNQIPHIFDRFNWSKNWITKQSESYGLGLYIAKSLIEAQGGTITVESKEGKGSIFTVSIPKK